MNKIIFGILLLISGLVFTACDQQKSIEPTQPVFQYLQPSETSVDFSNDLIVNDSVNFFQYGYYYMGGGVAIGDLNNDGLQDLYFTGNQVPNKLYLNQGNLQFKDVTSEAGVAGDNQWITGVAMHDVNADGLMDIYVSVAGIWTSTKNILYVNQGVNENGIPTFKDEAESRGVADQGLSIQSAFFDYDQDGDIDIYVANYEKTSFGTLIPEYKEKVDNPVWKSSDHLYENDGTGNFTDVTEQAGMLNFGLAIGVVASDFNNDGLTDLYVSNDFNTPDNFYFNNGDGTFSDLVKETTQHTAFYGMGVDAADINNDGLMDFVQVDMTPADNFRSKANMASMDIDGFWQNVDAGFHYQYMYNALQINQGIRDTGEPFFSDVAMISGIDKTDWSWASLFADYNNDGLNDLFITNGTRRDINNKDFFKWMGRMDIQMQIKYKELSWEDVTNKLPFKRVDNYMFKNLDGGRFEQSNQDWGIEFEGFSNGAAYADLDNDGDLEMVINNIDSAAAIFKNNAIENGSGNFLKIELQGSDKNPLALGSRVSVKAGVQTFLREQTLVRGYQSSIEPILHFGLGEASHVDEIIVTWPDGKVSKLSDISVNQKLDISYQDAENAKPKSEPSSETIFAEAKIKGLDDFTHQENDFDDYDYQILIPHRMSRFGPATAIADVNGDGLDDLYIGGAKGILSAMMIQNSNGSFSETSFAPQDSIYEDLDAVFFDADNDGDQDLYVVSGGNESPANTDAYQDRLYINENGSFKKSETLPNITISGGVALAEDFDGDGDLDLFVGGRQTPQQYPKPTSSLFLENVSENGEVRFENSEQPDFEKLGMVTSAVWLDLNGDQKNELVIAGEWMPISVFIYDDGEFYNKTKRYGFENTVGWWNTLEKADFDNDGDEDLIAGNLGLNYKYQATPEKTFDIYASDYDINGKLDIVLGYYQDDKQFPVRGMQCSSEQIPNVAKKYKNKYNKFAEATLADIYSEEALEDGLHYQAQIFSSVYIENTGSTDLKIKELPFEAQASSLNDLQVLDFNGDGNLDIVAGGNLFSSEVETPRNDACFGWLFEGDGKGNFQTVAFDKSGLYVPHDIKQVEVLKQANDNLIVFASNLAPLKVYKLH